MSQDTSNNVDLNCTIFAEPSGKIVRNAEFATFNPGHKCLWNNRCRITWEQTENVNMFGHVSVRQTSSSSFIIWCIFKCLLVLFVLTGIWTVLEQLTNSDWMLLTRLQSSLLFFFFFFSREGWSLSACFRARLLKDERDDWRRVGVCQQKVEDSTCDCVSDYYDSLNLWNSLGFILTRPSKRPHK